LAPVEEKKMESFVPKTDSALVLSYRDDSRSGKSYPSIKFSHVEWWRITEIMTDTILLEVSSTSGTRRLVIPRASLQQVMEVPYPIE